MYKIEGAEFCEKKTWNFPLKFSFPTRSGKVHLLDFTFFSLSKVFRFRAKSQKRNGGGGEDPSVCFFSDAGRERRKVIGSLRGNIAISISTPRNTRNDLRSGAWCFDGGQPEVNLRFTRQYRLLLAPPRALPRVPRGTARARAPHNSHNKSPRTTDARSTYKGITDQKEDRRVRVKRGEWEGWGGEGLATMGRPRSRNRRCCERRCYYRISNTRRPVPRWCPGESMKWTIRGNHLSRCLNLRGSLWFATTSRFGFAVMAEFSDN